MKGDAAPYLARAEAELLSLASWTTWNPAHFLDVSEATTAVALGYDWLYMQLNATTRATLLAAIAQRGLAPFAESFANHSRWPQGSTSK